MVAFIIAVNLAPNAYAAEEIAKIREMQIEEIIDITTRNAEEFFEI